MKVQNTKYESTNKQSAATLGENLALCYICHSTLTLSSSRISYKLVAVFYVIHIIIATVYGKASVRENFCILSGK